MKETKMTCRGLITALFVAAVLMAIAGFLMFGDVLVSIFNGEFTLVAVALFVLVVAWLVMVEEGK